MSSQSIGVGALPGPRPNHPLMGVSGTERSMKSRLCGLAPCCLFWLAGSFSPREVLEDPEGGLTWLGDEGACIGSAGVRAPSARMTRSQTPRKLDGGCGIRRAVDPIAPKSTPSSCLKCALLLLVWVRGRTKDGKVGWSGAELRRWRVAVVGPDVSRTGERLVGGVGSTDGGAMGGLTRAGGSVVDMLGLIFGLVDVEGRGNN